LKQQISRDDELWDSFKSGNQEAFASIYRLHYQALYSYGKRFLVDDALVEDAVQDLFIILWRTRANLSSVTNIKYYLFRSLRRDIHRISNKERRFEKADMETFLNSYDLLSEDRAFEEDEDTLAHKLSGVLQRLPKRQHEAILLRYYENFSVPEIADLMGISEKTVRNTLFNAIAQLRQNARFLTHFVELLAFYLLC
jgi:RNA polymerase sigma factor (sigma-70 family)